MRWFRGNTKIDRRTPARRGLPRPDGVYRDDEGRKWDVYVFRRSSVGAWWSDEQLDWSRKAAVVFRWRDEERVAVVDWEHDLVAAENLEGLFRAAQERRSGRDRRHDWKPVRVDRRVEPDRRLGDH